MRWREVRSDELSEWMIVGVKDKERSFNISSKGYVHE